jgi:uncharacterized protein YutE (UPF0331/DUF86 family)
MYDRERITRLVGDITRYLHDLDLLAIRTEEDLKERKNFYALSMVLFSLLTAVIDLGEEVVVANDLGIPSTYREVFFLLEQNGYIEHSLFGQMSILVSYRNRLAHEYGKIIPEDLIHILSQIDGITAFVGRVKGIMKADLK